MRPITPALLFLAMLGAPAPARAQGEQLPHTDRVRLAEAFRVAELVRPTVWPGWERTAMAILLVTDSAEFLIGHPRPSSEFVPLGRDPLLGRDVFRRPRQFPPTLLATFPAVGGVPTIVVGSAERTGKSSVEWVLTLLHEHFHQWQNALPDYYALADGLGLARGDTTGRWMLEYAFPYDSAPVRRALRDLASSLAESDLPAAIRARAGLQRLLSPEDYRYLEFQLWQEGVPRYIELAAAEAAAQAGKPAADFRALPDYEPYDRVAGRLRHALGQQLGELHPETQRRVVFYPLGAGVAALLQRIRADWKLAYEQHPFALAALLPSGN